MKSVFQPPPWYTPRSLPSTSELQTQVLRHPFSNHRHSPHYASHSKIQAQVYDIRPPTTALTGYATGLRKLSKWSAPRSLQTRNSKPNSKHRFYDTRPPTTALIGYAIGLRTLVLKQQLSLLQTTQTQVQRRFTSTETIRPKNSKCKVSNHGA